jgi:hypothetical protein
MPISTYAELQTSVADWMHRDDLTARIPDFVLFGEKTLNRKLRLLQQEATATLTLSSGNSSVSLPSGFLEYITLSYGPNEYPLSHLSPNDFSAYQNSTSGKPEYFNVAESIRFERSADQNYTLYLRYFKKWNIATDLTNWLLTNAPDAYLFSALAEGAGYVRNSEDQAYWFTRMNSVIDDLENLDARSRGKAELRPDPQLSGRSSFY